MIPMKIRVLSMKSWSTKRRMACHLLFQRFANSVKMFDTLLENICSCSKDLKEGEEHDREEINRLSLNKERRQMNEDHF